jgi:long-subunit acyl-CoA synthetase (AMP-forming)
VSGLTNDLQIIRPTLLPAVPRVLVKIFELIKELMIRNRASQFILIDFVPDESYFNIIANEVYL